MKALPVGFDGTSKKGGHSEKGGLQGSLWDFRLGARG
jgi:hypothetical protein